MAGSDGVFQSLPAREPIRPKAALAGVCWDTGGNSGTIGGADYLGTADNQPLELRANGLRVARYEPDAASPNVVAGNNGNGVNGAVHGAAIAGGGAGSDADPEVTAVVGPNRVYGLYGAVGGGAANSAGLDNGTPDQSPFATVAGGSQNKAQGRGSMVGGGEGNKATGYDASIVGGAINFAQGEFAGVLGGLENEAPGQASSVSGSGNCAGGDSSWAGGTGAQVRPGAATGGNPFQGCSGAPLAPTLTGDKGTFIWADYDGGKFHSSGSNQFLVRARGGFGLNAAPLDASVEMTITSEPVSQDYAQLWLKQRAVDNPGILLSVGNAGKPNDAELYIDQFNGSAQARRAAFLKDGSVFIRSNVTGLDLGVNLPAGDGAWSSLSDRNAKMAIEPVDPGAVLDHVAALPLSTWSYIAQGGAVRHMGPMAQDFSAEFGLGADATRISTVDADGVALAAIQGLNAKLAQDREEYSARMDMLERDGQQRVAALERAAADLHAQLEALRAQLVRLETVPH